MASFRDIRNLLVESFDDGDISEDEFLLLYDANTSKNPDFPYDCYGSFDLNEMDDSECLAEFRFHKNIFYYYYYFYFLFFIIRMMFPSF